MCYLQQRERSVLAHCGQQKDRQCLSLAFYRPKGSRRQGRSGSELVGGKRSAKERRIETEMQVPAARYSPLQLTKTVREFHIPPSYCGSRYKLFQLPEISLNLNSSTSPGAFRSSKFAC